MTVHTKKFYSKVTEFCGIKLNFRASLKNKTNCVFWSICRHNYADKGVKNKNSTFQISQNIDIFIMLFELHDIFHSYFTHINHSLLGIFYFSGKP